MQAAIKESNWQPKISKVANELPPDELPPDELPPDELPPALAGGKKK
ncbi:MAG: hypothetical protein WCP85_28120 [Mariniphaga sp.]